MALIISISILFQIGPLVSQGNYTDKVNTLDATIETLYNVISGDKGEKRDWELMRYLFHPDAKLIPSHLNKAGNIDATFMSIDEYITKSGRWLEENGFFEKEIYRRVENFSSITHVFSTYESFRTSSDIVPFMRGINSIQLMNDGDRWWIINIYWANETEENPIPQEYLPK